MLNASFLQLLRKVYVVIWGHFHKLRIESMNHVMCRKSIEKFVPQILLVNIQNKCSVFKMLSIFVS